MSKPSNNKKNYNRKNQKSNKSILIGIGSVLVICIAILIILPMLEEKHPIYGVAPSKLNAATQDILDNENYKNTISDETLDKKIENKEDFFVYMYSASCGYCLQTTPVIAPLADSLGIHLDQFNLLEYKTYQRKYNIESTPTLVYYEDGVEKARLEGGYTENEAMGGNTEQMFIDFFETHRSNQ